MSLPAPVEACREAASHDLPRVVELVAEAVADLRRGRGGEVWARTAARRAPYEPALAAALADPAHRVLVGTLDDVIVGYAVAHHEELPDGGRLGVVDDIYTETAARDLGVGELMMEDLLGWCRAAGCFGVDSLALPGDRHTKNFFESFGLVARAIVVHRDLG